MQLAQTLTWTSQPQTYTPTLSTSFKTPPTPKLGCIPLPESMDEDDMFLFFCEQTKIVTEDTSGNNWLKLEVELQEGTARIVGDKATPNSLNIPATSDVLTLAPKLRCVPLPETMDEDAYFLHFSSMHDISFALNLSPKPPPTPNLRLCIPLPELLEEDEHFLQRSMRRK